MVRVYLCKIMFISGTARKFGAMALSLTFMIVSAGAQYYFSGTILGKNDRPLTGARICPEADTCLTTDRAGRFYFLSGNPSVKIAVFAAGYTSRQQTVLEHNLSVIRLFPSSETFSEVIVQAFDTRLRLRETPAAVGVLNRPDLSRFANTVFVQAMNTMPGVKMDERSPGSYRLSIRGNILRSPFGIRNVKMYWEGIPFTDAGGTTYFNQIDFNEIGRVEIIRGPVGSIYGAGTGGTVLLYTALPDSASRSITVNSLGGSYGTLGISAAYASRGNSGSTTLRYSHLQSDGWRQHTRMRRDKMFYSGIHRTGKRSELHSIFFYSRLNYQTPGGLTLRQMDSAARQSRPASGTIPSAAAQQAGIFLNTAFGGLSHQVAWDNRWSNTTSLYFSSTNTLNPALLNYQNKKERGLGGRSVMRYRSERLQVHLGVEFQYTFTESDVYGNKGGKPDTLQFNDQIRSRQLNLFIQAMYRLPADIRLQAGLGYNHFAYGFTRLNREPVIPFERIFPAQLVPRVSLIRSFGEKFSVHLSVSKGYSPPTIDEVVPSTGQFNAGLLPETALSTEAGFRMAVAGGRLVADLSLYRMRLREAIVLQRDAAGADYFLNAGGTLQQGMELGLRYPIPVKEAGWISSATCRIGLTLQRARFNRYLRGPDDFSGNRLPGIPDRLFSLAADLVTRDRVSLHLTLNHTGVIPLNEANTVSAPAYLLSHLRIDKAWTLGKKLSATVFGAADYSFNRPYSLGNDINASGGRYYNPAAPYNFTLGLEIKRLLEDGPR